MALGLGSAVPATAATTGNRPAAPVVHTTRATAAPNGSGGASTQPAPPKPAKKKKTARVTVGGHHYPGDSRHLGDRIIRPGMTGHDVRVLQDYLTKSGYPTGVDGQYGPGTKRSVVAFQRAHHEKADGVVTWAVSQALRKAEAAGQAVPQTSSVPTSRGRVVNGLAVAPSSAPASVKAVIAAGNQIAFKPYIYGGGHGTWYDSGYDCSGSVSFALHGAGLLNQTEDSGELESYGSPGAGRWITIWANAGHVYMYVAGLRFDTSAQSSNNGSRWTSASRSNSGFVERHPTGL